MANFNDLIKELNELNFQQLTEEEKEEKRNRVHDDMHAYLKQAKKNNIKAQRAYTFTSFGKVLGKALLPVGVLLPVAALATGATGSTAHLFAGTGLAYGIVGTGLQYFLCTDKRIEELKNRAKIAEEEYNLANDYLNNI